MSANSKPSVGAVAIGRNEGERLKRCLQSLKRDVDRLVYVDSGSTDGSVELARELGAEVVELDMSKPFTAARARNAGAERLLSQDPKLDFIQFVDGDCEVVEGWIALAQEALLKQPRVGVVCGRRCERFPEASIYNQLCDIEWNTPVGEADACGGDAMMRTKAFEEVSGFDPTLIAGEEPDLCLRMRRRGWRILRLEADMTLHDAAIHHFRQWWRRQVRSGHAFAEGSWRHGLGQERHWVKETARIWMWGIAAPTAIVGLSLPTLGLSSLLSIGYVRAGLGGYRLARNRGYPKQPSRVYGAFCALGRFPEAQGALKFYRNLLRGRTGKIIEYK